MRSNVLIEAPEQGHGARDPDSSDPMTLQVMQIRGFSQRQQSGEVRHRDRSDSAATIAAQTRRQAHTPACPHDNMPTRGCVVMQTCLRELLSKATERFQAKPVETSGSNPDQRYTASLPGNGGELQSRPCVIMPERKPPRQRGSGRFGVIVGRIILPVKRHPSAATTLPAHCRTIMRRRAPDTEASD